MKSPKPVNIQQEAREINKRELSLELVYILMGENKGSEEERARLNRLIQEKKEKVYIEAVFLLTHIKIDQPIKAKQILDEIIEHRNTMVKLLGRNVSIQVSAMDYLQNIKNILKKPTIIELDKCHELAEKAISDELTEAYNKDILVIDLEKEMTRAKRYKHPLSIAFIDIDDLKKINDSYGHIEGTNAIKFVSRCIKENLRKFDSIYRYGGDEFVILLPGSDEKNTVSISNRIIKNTNRRNENLRAKPTLSIGIASNDKNSFLNYEEFIKAADTALYIAKKNGKNQIHVYKNEYSPSRPMKVSAPDLERYKNKIKGKPIVEGMAIGKVFQYKNIIAHESAINIETYEMAEEFARIETAIEKVHSDLDILKANVFDELGENHSMIFDVHKQFLYDIELLNEIKKELEDNLISAEQSVKNVFNRFKIKFKSSNSTMVQEKTSDLEDVEQRLIRKLTGRENNILSEIEEGSIIYTQKLTPTDIIHLKRKNVQAIVTQECGYTSHASIIARSLGIPLITDIAMNNKWLEDGLEIIVDGYSGIIYLQPDEAQKRFVKDKILIQKKDEKRIITNIKNKKLSPKEGLYKISASISTDEDFKNAAKYNCDSIGLLRIEPIYMHLNKLPDENELYKILDSRLINFKNNEITLRLADFGGDKPLPFLSLSNEFYSKLGLRGIRFLFQQLEILTPQIRVILRLSSKYNIRILIPMVTNVEDIEKTRNIITHEMEKLNKENILFNEQIQLGSMIEVPSALFTINQILSVSDFINLGTNDLIQYITAADRDIDTVTSYHEIGKTILLKQILNILECANKLEKECTICGELAGDLDYTEKLLKTGLTSFSVTPRQIPYVKTKIFSLL